MGYSGALDLFREVDMDSTGHLTRPLLLRLLLGSVLWTSCLAAHSQCYFSSQAQCEYGGKQYLLGDSWMEANCFQCTCLHPVGVGCCETLQRPVDFPAWCEVRVEMETCRVTLVQKADKRLPCFSRQPGSLDPAHPSLNMELEG